MVETIFTLTPWALAAVPVVIALVEVAKQTFSLPSKLAPLASIALGVGTLMLVPDQMWQASIVQGVLVGLAASGLYSGTRAVVSA